MSFVIRRIYEYSMVCDKCGYTEVLHTGDYVGLERDYIEPTPYKAERTK